mmetsp:Transcript_39753/g.71347  ORF Transcript_39753/g.71347 Transcript_39753/m.71347 type:complete len:145 (-) Transcript_39753:216-650(-)|eukprot:CAMPEP_0168608372 /NCGR_PEP_ID=MMETSP0449_2-20121227/592_1 /TAXON_ID=1082188 /ORGANISM="Strombidium rassoulzadegani, Strain ras09" /LENGTH=144 /DNA_ID=CAMNT_0008648353 /DNA_START=114 /DNA_END=548 /DNA_ORIENTATION=-
MSRSLFHPFSAATLFSLDHGPTRGHDSPLEVDVFEGECEYTVYADMPGLGQEDVKLELQNRALTVFGNSAASNTPQPSESEAEGKQTPKRARVPRAYRRTFQLPNDVDEENIAAVMDKGVLQLSLPKRKSALPRQIAISGPAAK